MNLPRLCCLFLAVVLAAACSSPGPRERDALRLQQFLDAAGEPVDGFHFFTMHSWEGLGPDAVAVWTRVNEVWLLRVERPCIGLEFARAIAVTSSNQRVTRRFDAVRFDDQRCRIEEIRPVDARAVRGRSSAAG